MATETSEKAGLATVMDAWERMLQGLPPVRGGVRSLIQQSWQRSLSLKVGPESSATTVMDDDALRRVRQRQSALIETARPIMAQAKNFLADTGTVMVLSDPDCIVLWMEGDARVLEEGKAIGLVPGGNWHEAIIGTNGIGTALAVNMPVQIQASEHFAGGIKSWTCSGAPIHDPIDGQILGVLDISGVDADHSHCLALAAAEAQRIEISLAQADAEKRGRLLTTAFAQVRRWMDGGVVIFDHHGKVVHANRHACNFLTERGLPEDFWQSEPIRAALTEGDAAGLPSWFDRDWIERVSDSGDALGTLLALPAGPAKRQPTLSEALQAIVGGSPAMLVTKAKAQQLARLNTPVLLQGPTGAGKEVFARGIHLSGPAAAQTFLAVNCGAFNRELLASELFGYADGAFTGARRGGAIGKFEAASGGTLFLDEIGEMPLDLQAYLLRVLEEGMVYRIGENRPRRVAVRIITATNRDLGREVDEKRFRADLYYRLSVAQLKIPALGERREDIAPLAEHFAAAFATQHGLPRRCFDDEVIAALERYDWPGNVRQLRNVVESMLALSDGDRITRADLPPELAEPAAASLEADGRLSQAEAAAIRDAIEAENRNLTKAALRLGIAKSTLYLKMQRYGITR